MVMDVLFHLFPGAVVITDFFAVCAKDRAFEIVGMAGFAPTTFGEITRISRGT
jgi:hypothetical protein